LQSKTDVTHSPPPAGKLHQVCNFILQVSTAEIAAAEAKTNETHDKVERREM
jgi:hypothetical protein